MTNPRPEHYIRFLGLKRKYSLARIYAPRGTKYMAGDAIKSAKLDRRTAKATLTRCRKALSKQVEIKRPGIEVKDALNNLQNAFHDLVVKHESYSKLIDDNEEFEVRERWMEECQELFMDTEIQAKIYLDNLVTRGKEPLKTGSAGENTSSAEPEASVSEISSMQSSENKGTMTVSLIQMKLLKLLTIQILKTLITLLNKLITIIFKAQVLLIFRKCLRVIARSEVRREAHFS